MRKVFVTYHHEGDVWWAESTDIAGLTVVGSTLAEVRALVRDGMDFYLEGEQARIVEHTDDGCALTVDSAVDVAPAGWWSVTARAAGGIADSRGGAGVTVTSSVVAAIV